MRKVWVLQKSVSQPTTYFVSDNRLPTNRTDKARWYESEHHANSNLTFDMKHNGYVAKSTMVSCTANLRHSKGVW